jgi:hypothetical protein
MKKNPEQKDPNELARQLYSSPRDPKIDKRKAKFEAINAYVTKRCGWMTSIPGDAEMRFDALPDSNLPQELHDMGYSVIRVGQSQRILPHAIVGKFTTRADGELEPLAEGSRKAVSTRITHAGIVQVNQFELRAPSAPPDQGKRIPP